MQKEKFLHIRVSPAWLAAIDKWRESQTVPPTRSDVVRMAVEKFVRGGKRAKIQEEKIVSFKEKNFDTLEAGYSHLAKENERLRAMLAEARAAMAPFANIRPQFLRMDDG